MKISEKQAKKIIKNLGKRHGIYVDVMEFDDHWELIGSPTEDDLHSKSVFLKSFLSKYICDRDGEFINVDCSNDRKYRCILNKLMKMSKNNDVIFPYYYDDEMHSLDDSHLTLISEGKTLYELLIEIDLNSLEI